MQRTLILLIATFATGLSNFSFAADKSFALVPNPSRSVSELVRAESFASSQAPVKIIDAGERAWRYSLAGLFAAQGLDAASSFGMRELNPILAGSDGRFGMKAAGIKFGAVGVAALVEYLVVRRHPNAARALAKINWSGAALTSAFAVHNYSIK